MINDRTNYVGQQGGPASYRILRVRPYGLRTSMKNVCVD